jgi:hypothetical protein
MVVVDLANPAERTMREEQLRVEVGVVEWVDAAGVGVVEWVDAAGVGMTGSSAQGHGPRQPDAAMPLTSMAQLPGGTHRCREKMCTGQNLVHRAPPSRGGLLPLGPSRHHEPLPS